MDKQLYDELFVHKYVMLESFFRGKNSYQDKLFAVRLKERCEVDLQRPRSTYTRKTVLGVMQLMAEYYYPGKSLEEAYYELGYDSLEGYRHTIFGRVALAVLKLKLVTPERVLQVVLKAFNDSDDNAVRQLVKNNATDYSFLFRDDPLDPYASHGLVQAILEDTRFPFGKASLQLHSLFNFDINVRWMQPKNDFLELED